MAVTTAGPDGPNSYRRLRPDDVMKLRSDLWHTVHAERAALVDDLAGLRSEQWATPSLCDEWDVLDVVAHLAATATLSPVRFVKEFLFAVQVLKR